MTLDALAPSDIGAMKDIKRAPWPMPRDGQTAIEARIEQVEAWRAAQPKRTPIKISKPTSARRLKNNFADFIPRRPYCTDDPQLGVCRCPREVAVRCELLQPNPEYLITFLCFDIDRRDAIDAARKADLPPPSFISMRPSNGHAHATWAIKSPVSKFDASRSQPILYAAAIQRAYAKRLGSDPGFSGLLIKNPLSEVWETRWGRPYTLGALASAVSPAELREKIPRGKRAAGIGRNVSCFDDTRQWAYREVLKFKAAGAPFGEWQQRCIDIAAGHNLAFTEPLPFSEVKGIGKSIAKWTWRKFSSEAYSARQSRCGSRGSAKRWKGHVAAEKTKPWEAEGISRSTWYARKKAARPAKSDNGPIKILPPVAAPAGASAPG